MKTVQIARALLWLSAEVAGVRLRRDWSSLGNMAPSVLIDPETITLAPNSPHFIQVHAINYCV